MSTRKLSLPTMLAYGFGQTAEAVKNVGFTSFLLFYYNQVIGISATMTSIILAMALVADAVTDPLAGSLSDKFQSKWGRRHPFLLAASIPLAVSFYFLFNPPDGLSDLGYGAWLLCFAILVRTSMTAYHVPHLALGAELASDYDQRSTLYSFNTFFSAIGTALFLPLSYALFFPTTEAFNPALLNQAAYSPWSMFAGGIMIFSIVICVFGTAKEIPYLKANNPNEKETTSIRTLIAEILTAFSNSSFRAIFFGMILSTFVIAIENVFNPFMGFYFWGMSTEQLKFIPAGSLVGLAFALFAIPIMTRRFDKKPTLIGAALVVIININTPIVLALTDPAWFPEPGSNTLLYLLIASASVTSFFGVTLFTTINSMFADICDEHELTTGKRQEGIIFAARAFALKACLSLGLIAGGILLDFIAFPKGAIAGQVDPEIIWQLGFIAGPATSFFTFFGMYLYLGYRIDRKRHAEIRAAIAERAASA